MKTVAAYIRVSTEEQSELSPDSQLEKIREYAARNDMDLPDEYIFQDIGISGRKVKNRPAFNKMVALAKESSRPFDAVLVWKFSRFSRSQEESILYKNLLKKKYGVAVISISEDIPDDEFGKLIERIIEWMDEFYSTRLAGEVRRGMEEAVNRGYPVTIAPFGYKMQKRDNKNPQKLIVDEDKAKYVKMMYDDFESGMGTREIAQKLNAMEIRTTRGNLWENRTVEDILKNRTYIGFIHWNPKGRTRRYQYCEDVIKTKGAHEPIISEEQFERVQERIKKNKEMYGKYKRAQGSAPYMLHGLVKCSSCGATLTRATTDSLQCLNYARGKCKTSHSIKLAKITPMVVTLIQKMVEGTIPPVFSNPIPEKHDNTDVMLAEAKKRLERIFTSYERGIYDEDTFIERSQKVKKEIEQIEKARPKSTAPAITKTHFDVVKIITDPNESEEKKNTALSAIVDKIIFNRTDGSVVVKMKHKPTDIEM